MKPSVSSALAALSVAAIALSTLAVVPEAAAQAAAPAASAASAPVFAVRAEVRSALQQAVDRVSAGKAAEAKTLLETAQATLPNLLPAEATVLHRIRGLIELQLEQYPAAVQSLQAALAAGAQSAQDALQCREALARAQFNQKAYPAAAEAARQAQAAGSRSAAVQAVLVRAVYLQGDFAGTIGLLQAQQQREGKLGLEDLRILASAYGQLKDDANYVRLTEQLLREHGRQEYWPDLLSRVQRQEGWQARWDIDVYRLRLRLGLMDIADDYMLLAELAAKAGLPSEAQKVLDAGFARGLLGKGAGATEQNQLRSRVTRQAADDRGSLEAAASRPPQVGDARAAATTFNTGAALVGIGRTDAGLALMKAALAGPLADAAQAQLQYGQALAAAGMTTQANAAFDAIATQPQLGLLARLWKLAVQTPVAPRT